MEISWIQLILDADPDYYDEDYNRPVVYEFSGDREFRQEDYP
jgi:hypothetical protein|tara:strand:+ start:225 stop:350 length:126 start_codon:yes stop_codon:yes gene_type:complete